MNYKIREAKKNDYNDISSIVKEVHDLHVKARPNDYKSCEDPLSKNIYLEMLDSHRYKIFVAIINDSIVGYTVLKTFETKNHPIMHDRIWIHIDDLCITKDFRRKGIGKALYLKALEYCKENNIDKLDLNVWSFNKDAIKFYKALGMKEKFIKFESNQ